MQQHSKYSLFPRFTNNSSRAALPGGPTLAAAENSAQRFLADLALTNSRQQLACLGVGTSSDRLVASYSGAMDSASAADGFEVRGVRVGASDAGSLLLSKHYYLSDAKRELKKMESDPSVLNGYQYVYATSTMNPMIDLDGFEPREAAGWVSWLKRLVQLTSWPYLIIAKPFRGVMQHLSGHRSFKEALEQYRAFHRNPLEVFVRLARSILLIDGNSGATIEEFLVSDRLEEIDSVSVNQIWRPCSSEQGLIALT